jgi:hypothetical protein
MGEIFFLYAVLSFACYARTRSQSHLIAAIYLAFAALATGTAPAAIRRRDPRLYYLFLLGMVSFGLWLAYLTVTRRAKWRGREILDIVEVLERYGVLEVR